MAKLAQGARPRAAGRSRPPLPAEAVRAAPSRPDGSLGSPASTVAPVSLLLPLPCIEELAQACASTSVIVGVHKRRQERSCCLEREPERNWLPRLASGEAPGGVCAD